MEACVRDARVPIAAKAEEPAKPPAPSSDPQLLDYARSNPSCNGFTDLCQTCIRTADQSVKCSTPGIACVKQVWTCTEQHPETPLI
jgi:hypothetical protein